MKILSSINKLNLQQEINVVTILFLFIPLLFFAAFFIFPIGYTLYLSFHEWNGFTVSMKPVGIENYITITKDPHFISSVRNNTKWLIYYVMIPPALALALALITSECIKGKDVFEVIYFLPNAITLIAVASIFKWLYKPGGVLNSILKGMGLQALTLNWLGTPQIATYSIMLAALWAGVGVSFLIFTAGLKLIPKELIDAAKIDGAGYLKTFRYVVWPMLTPSTIIVEVFSAVGAMRVFDLIYSMTTYGTEYYTSVIGTYLYERSFHSFKIGEGASAAIILFVLAALIISPYLIYANRNFEKIQE